MASKKKIIFFGATGTGKSTIASALYKENMSDTNNYFPVDNSSQLRQFGCQIGHNNNWIIYDIVGIGSNYGDVYTKNVFDFLKKIDETFDYVCLVLKRGRIRDVDKMALGLVSAVVESIANVILIVTDATDTWLHENRRELFDTYGNMNMVAVNFPPHNPNLENFHVDIRIKSLEILLDFFGKINPNPMRCTIGNNNFPTILADAANGLWNYTVYIWNFIPDAEKGKIIVAIIAIVLTKAKNS